MRELYQLVAGALLVCLLPFSAAAQCDNVTDGGTITGDETGCADPTFDPAAILSVQPATGGSGGEVQYIWMQTTDDPTQGNSVWLPIPGTNSPDYDPGPISQTTHYVRCARRTGCTDYTAETSYVTKTVNCCDNVTDGGSIGFDQSGCAPYDATTLQNVVSPSGGTGELEYLWFGSFVGGFFDPTSPDWFPLDNSNTAGYDPGTLTQTTFFIRCSRRAGCDDYTGETNIIEIEVLASPQLEVASNDISCFGENDGTITLTVNGDDTPYTIEWSDGSTEAVRTDLNAGNYSVTVTGNNSCTATEDITLAEPDLLTVSIDAQNVSCFGGTDGSITAVVSGGTPGYSYDWNNGNFPDQPTLDNIGIGQYDLVVTDANGCTATASVVIEDMLPLLVELETQVDCENAGGTIVALVTSGEAPYEFMWSDGSTDSILVEVDPGTYTLTVTDANGCETQETTSFTLGDPLELAISATDVSCTDGNSGTVEVSVVEGGTAPFTYQWNDPMATTGPTLTGVGMGTYSVTVIDANGCTETATATVQGADALQLNLQSSPAGCFGENNGAATVGTNSTGTPPFTYEWSTGATTQSIDGLTAGMYTVTVTDAAGCSAVGSTNVEEASEIEFGLSIQNILCSGEATGGADIDNIIGGTAPYTILYSNNTTGATVSGLPAGDFSVTVFDAEGCSTTRMFVVEEPDALVLSTQSLDASCNNLNDGGVSVAVDGGTAPYQIEWSTGATTSVVMGLSEGTYTVTVTDVNGCTETATATIEAATEISIAISSQNITCNGDNTGSITATPSGGQGNYAFNWSNGTTTATIDGLAAGIYSVTVMDSGGCTAAETVMLTEPNELILALMPTNNVCADASDGTIDSNVMGGTPPFTYQWNTGATESDLENLPSGTYTLTVTDANGCTDNATAVVSSSNDLALNVQTDNMNCAGETATLTALPSNGTGPYIYLWSTGADTPSISVGAGTYSVTVTDADGCTRSADTTVEQPEPVVCGVVLENAISQFGGTDGVLSVNVQSGIAPFSYEWSTGTIEATIAGLASGTYTVTVTDANGCICTSDYELNGPSKIGDFVFRDLDGDGIQDANETGVSNVGVTLSGSTGSGNVSLTTTTDLNGMYMFDGLLPGSYKLSFDLPNTFGFSPANVGGNDQFDSDVNPATGMTETFGLSNDTYDDTRDAGLTPLDETTNLGNMVFFDTDRDGIMDAGETGIANVVVRLYDANTNSVVASETTDANGKYLFTDVEQGPYFIEFVKTTLPFGYVFSEADQGSDDALDSDADPTDGRTEVFAVFPFSPDDLTRDAGAYLLCDDVTDPGSIAGNQTLCGPDADPDVLVSMEPASGGSGMLEYLWLSSDSPIYSGPGDPNWQPVPDSNTPELDPGIIGQTTYYIRCARREGCDDFIAETNIVEVEVIDGPFAAIEEGPFEQCADETSLWEAAIAGGGATYSWTFENGSPASAATRKVNGVSWTVPGTYTVTLSVTRFGCTTTITRELVVEDCAGIQNFTITDLGTQGVHLYWEAGFDDATYTYFVESSDNGTDFRTLEQLPNSPEAAYECTDERPFPGRNWYRIKALDLTSGAVIWSTTERLDVTSHVAARAMLHPNVAAGSTTLTMLRPSDQPVRVLIADAYGQVVERLELPAHSTRTELMVDELVPGIYTVHLRGRGLREFGLRLVVVR